MPVNITVPKTVTTTPAVTPSPDLISFLSHNPIIVVVLVVIVGIIILVWKRKPKEDHFKKISLKKLMNEEMKHIFSVQAETLGFGKQLRRGSYKIGKVLKSVFYSTSDLKLLKLKELHNKKSNKDVGIMDLEEETEEETNKTEKSKKPEQFREFYAFKTCRNFIIFRLLARYLNVGTRYFIVDKDLITESLNDYVIDIKHSFVNFLGITVFSLPGRSLVESLVFKIGREQDLEEMINFYEKMIYASEKNSSDSATIKLMSELKKKREKDSRESLLQDV